MITSDELTENDGKILNNILSLMEYAYRLGVYHGAMSKDPSEIQEVMDMPLEDKKFRIIRDAYNKVMNINKFCDVVVMWCSNIGAMYLRNFLREDSKIYTFKAAILIMAFVYYRDGLTIGLRYDRVTARNFFDTVYRGMVHINAVTRKKRTKESFFDEMKFKVNNLHEQLVDSDVPSGLNRLSTFMGTTWVKYMT